MLRPLDNRIANLCQKYGLKYTRFVDNFTISGLFDFSRSGFPDVIGRILEGNGFSRKDEFGRVEVRVFIVWEIILLAVILTLFWLYSRKKT